MSSRGLLLNALLYEIFGGYKRMFKKVCAEYVAKQREAKKDPDIWSFFFNGELYFDTYLDVSTKATQLDPSLADQFAVDIAQWDIDSSHDYALIKHTLISTLNTFTSLEDLKVIFPASLHNILDKYSDLFSGGNPNPDKAIRWREERMAKYVPKILQYMAFSLIVEK